MSEVMFPPFKPMLLESVVCIFFAMYMLSAIIAVLLYDFVCMVNRTTAFSCEFESTKSCYASSIPKYETKSNF